MPHAKRGSRLERCVLPSGSLSEVSGGNAPGGLALVLDGEVAQSIRQVAKKWSLAILEAESADLAFRNVRSTRPGVVVLQIGQQTREALRFIGLTLAIKPRIPLVVAVTHHSASLERKVLRAGPVFYVPGLESKTLDSLLEATIGKDATEIAD